MFYAVLAGSVLLPITMLFLDIRKAQAAQLVLSHFWYFTFIFLAAFPLRAWLLSSDLVVGQMERFTSTLPQTDGFLTNALVIATLFWCAVLIGYRSIDLTLEHRDSSERITVPRPSWQVIAGYVLFLIIAIAAVHYLDPDPGRLDGLTYFASRKGAGIVWIMPEFFVFAVIILAGFITSRPDEALSKTIIVLLFLGLAVSAWISIELLTRRTLASVILASVIVLVVYRNRLWPLALIGVIGTVLASPVFELLRRIPGTLILRPDLENVFFPVIENVLGKSYLMFLSTGFEGIGHLGQLIAKASWVQLLTGVDHGVSWAFNMGLALIPRQVWEGKPDVYGGFSEFRWLYPESFIGDQATIAAPPSMAVDFSFGFGIPAGLILAFILGRFFAVCQRRLWDPLGNPAVLAISLYTFVFMFNIVRGGTVHGQSLALLGMACFVMLGPRTTIQGFAIIAAEMLGPRFIRGQHKP